jgi:hypothetical protein
MKVLIALFAEGRGSSLTQEVMNIARDRNKQAGLTIFKGIGIKF